MVLRLWLKRTPTTPLRGPQDDGVDVAQQNVRRTAAQKVTHLELMLWQRANFVLLCLEVQSSKTQLRLIPYDNLFVCILASNQLGVGFLISTIFAWNQERDRMTFFSDLWVPLQTIC